MKIKVMKFGGTSLKSITTRNYVYNIVKENSKNYKLVLVVSAQGRFPDAYATDTLLSYTHESMSAQEKAWFVSLGEQFSTLRVCSELLELGFKAKAIPMIESGIQTDEKYEYANIVNLDNSYLKKYLNTYDILVVSGFLGINHMGKITTLGRGGSDFSAVLYAHMLNLNEVEIYTDVDGVYDSDPNINKQAKKLEELKYDEMLNLKSKVLDNRCVRYASKNHIRIYLKGTFSKEKGTLIKE